MDSSLIIVIAYFTSVVCIGFISWSFFNMRNTDANGLKLVVWPLVLVWWGVKWAKGFNKVEQFGVIKPSDHPTCRMCDATLSSDDQEFRRTSCLQCRFVDTYLPRARELIDRGVLAPIQLYQVDFGVQVQDVPEFAPSHPLLVANHESQVLPPNLPLCGTCGTVLSENDNLHNRKNCVRCLVDHGMIPTVREMIHDNGFIHNNMLTSPIIYADPEAGMATSADYYMELVVQGILDDTPLNLQLVRDAVSARIVYLGGHFRDSHGTAHQTRIDAHYAEEVWVMVDANKTASERRGPQKPGVPPLPDGPAPAILRRKWKSWK